MPSPELENLVRVGKLKRETPSRSEFEGLSQTLPHTLGLPAATWRVLAKSHEKRNQSEYGGVLEIDDRLLSDLIEAARAVLGAVNEVEPPEAEG